MPTDDAPARPVWSLVLVLACEVLALTVFNTPQERLTRYLYNDSGADLTIPNMIARGFRPTIDFGYIYGLLPLAATSGFQTVLGADTTALQMAALASNLLLAWGLAQLVRAARVGPVGIGLIVVALPALLESSTIVLVHALEPALLVMALAQQARGRRSWALALVTADLFVKPAMAYLYGFLLILAIVTDRSERARWRSMLAPAAVTGLILLLGLESLYGLRPLLNTLVPGAGLEVYRQNHYGFFHGVGREFWVLPRASLRDYFRYEVGAWLAGTAVLLTGGTVAMGRIVRGRRTAVDEVVATCAALHATFVCLFFGSRGSWVYYYAVLVVGLAAMATRCEAPVGRVAVWLGRTRWQNVAVGLVALLTLVGSKAKLQTTVRLWRTDKPAAETLALWASPTEREEWLTVLRMCVDEERAGHGRSALLARVEGGAILAPTVFSSPQAAYLVPGHAIEPELKRKAEQLAHAALVVRVRPRSDKSRGGYDRWPEIARALESYHTIWEGELFEVARRTTKAR